MFGKGGPSGRPCFLPPPPTRVECDVKELLNRGIEVIWGLATDESLDEDVKITILATGFGVSNIPGMNTTIQVNNNLA